MPMNNYQTKAKIIITIDGFSSCGKSTLAKALAKKLNYVYIDTGAMYRAVTYYFLTHQTDPDDPSAIEKAMENIEIELKPLPEGTVTYLNGINVEMQIRSMEVSNAVSEISAIPAVREKVVAMQRALGALKGIVMEGRDIGTVVFPEAELKIFLTAKPEIRMIRRYLEVRKKGKNLLQDEVKANLEKRDHIDSTRAHSPLRKADDAIEIDNSYLTVEDQVRIIMDMI